MAFIFAVYHGAMLSLSGRRIICTQQAFWCLLALLLTALQPFLAVHFTQNGWEDEPGLRVRSVGEVTQFEVDAAQGQLRNFETTLYVPATAPIDGTDAFQGGLDMLLMRVGLLMPLTIAVLLFVAAVPFEAALRLAPYRSAAPPRTRPWRRMPPQAAPPPTN
ncbi:hypothetical protein [Variovorax ginsengisoli]|uniref:Uncharacterized protein n=1 Tax=Variovorax ginsengisoli TaxID=363844 RepID=A0ABT9SCJ9_9BURK|nr:hypothetical protein [Variovorax ginsengisoli]MDP9902078.1 hypothetical protein [Variovorax ginsengisoli]